MAPLPLIANVDLYTEGDGTPFRAVCRGCRKVWRADSSPEDYTRWLNSHRNHNEEH